MLPLDSQSSRPEQFVEIHKMFYTAVSLLFWT